MERLIYPCDEELGIIGNCKPRLTQLPRHNGHSRLDWSLIRGSSEGRWSMTRAGNFVEMIMRSVDTGHSRWPNPIGAVRAEKMLRGNCALLPEIRAWNGTDFREVLILAIDPQGGLIVKYKNEPKVEIQTLKRDSILEVRKPLEIKREHGEVIKQFLKRLREDQRNSDRILDFGLSILNSNPRPQRLHNSSWVSQSLKRRALSGSFA